MLLQHPRSELAANKGTTYQRNAREYYTIEGDQQAAVLA